MDSEVQTEVLKIIMKRIPLVHCMNDKKPLKLISDSDFQNLGQKYSFSIPCLIISIGSFTYQPEFSQGFRHITWNYWDKPDKMIFIQNMLDLW